MKRFKRILIDIGTDRDPGPALQRAIILARQNDADVTVVAVAPALPPRTQLLLPAEVGELIVRDRKLRLAAAASRLEAADVRVASKVLVGKHAVEVIRQVVREGHDLVLRAHTVSKQFGPIDMKLLRKCPCPVWLVAAPHEGPQRRILATVKPDPDDSAGNALNRIVLELATSLAELDRGELLILHVWSLYGESVLRPRLKPDELSELLENARIAAERSVHDLLQPFAGQIRNEQVHFAKGFPGDVIPEFVAAHDVDLLVMGTLARSGVAGVITGNTAEQVLGKVRCSLIAIKPAGFVSPIAP